MIHFMTWMTDICKPYLPWQQSKVCIINKTKCSCIPESNTFTKEVFLPSHTTNYYLKINLDCDLFSILQRTGHCVVLFQTWAVIAPTLTNIVMFNMFFRFNIQKRLKQLIHGFTNLCVPTNTDLVLDGGFSVQQMWWMRHFCILRPSNFRSMSSVFWKQSINNPFSIKRQQRQLP